MFLDELTPFFRQLTTHPVAFLGGLTSGLLRLNLADEPVNSWLKSQGGTANTAPGWSSSASDRNGSGPQSITID